LLPEIPDLALPISIVLPPEGCRFAGDKLKHGMCEELQRFSIEFCASFVQRLSKDVKKCGDSDGGFMEK
jgi:hypothetical protein